MLNVIEFQDEIEIGLKFICFILKRMLLNLKDLEKLIKFLYNIHDRFISGIKFDNIDTISTWLDIFNAFTEILFMVSVNYNDLVIEEYLNNNKSNSFLHTKSESGQLLFKMIIDIEHYLKIRILNTIELLKIQDEYSIVNMYLEKDF